MPSSSNSDPARPSIDDIRRAADILNDVAVRTPLLESRRLSERLGYRLFLKAEPLQLTGSFKIRGAYNRIAAIAKNKRASGVVAYSSGNHGQGVAAAARLLGVPAVIVMPADAPTIKIESTRAWGAEIVLYDRRRESREAIAERLARERDATLVKPFDDCHVIAGQGTVGLEIAAQLAARGADADTLVCGTSGGGLLAGIAIAFASEAPAISLYAAEPAGFDDTARSLAAGQRMSNNGEATSFCDALLQPTPGEITFAINRSRLAGGVVVTDAEVADAMRVAFEYFKLVLEPSGAVGLAAALTGRVVAREGLVVVATGGNVDPALYAKVLTGWSG